MRKTTIDLLCRTGIIVCLLGASAVAYAQVKPVLTITYDKDFNGVGRDGRPIAGTPLDKPVLVPGKSGQALKSGPTTGYVQYPSKDILNTQSGTVEMWISPVDWSSDDNKFHVFFEALGQGALTLYKFYAMPSLLMQSTACQVGPNDFVNAPVHPLAMDQTGMGWKSGQWHHIAGTWSSRGMKVYIDGKTLGGPAVHADTPRGDLLPFRIGDHPRNVKGIERTSSSLIDDVRIYDRELSPAHIAAHYEGNYEFAVPLAAETSRLDFKIDPDAKMAQVSLDLGASDVKDASLRAKCAIVPKGRKLPSNAAALTFTSGLGSGVLPLPSPGEYEVVARLLLDGKEAFELRTDLIVPTTEWLGNKIGLEDKVLPPWTPMKVQGTTASCWGREYHFGDGALPTQIVSAGTDLLARPVTFRAISEGKPLTWTLEKPHTDSSSPTAVKISSHATVTGSDKVVMNQFAPVTIAGETSVFNIRVTTEYDGLALYEVTVNQTTNIPFDALSLEIPVKAEHALYGHVYTTITPARTSGNVPKGEGVVQKTDWVPYAWLGDNDRGLFWFCESDEMWPNRAAENAIEIVRSGQEVAIRLNLLAPGQKLTPNWKFVFGLQATPTKPTPRDGRKWRLGEAPRVTVAIPFPSFSSRKTNMFDPAFIAFGYPEAGNPQVFTKDVKGYHDKGVKVTPYVGVTFMSDGMPESVYFRKLWDIGGTDNYVSISGWKYNFVEQSPVGRGYSDFLAWKLKKYLDDYNLDGIYIDQTSPYQSPNIETGIGYERDGVRYRTYPILGYRALYRRVYAIIKALPRETFIMVHMSGKMDIPVVTYSDAYLNGEHLAALTGDSTYIDFLPLDTFRAEYMGRQWGSLPVFLPEFRTPKLNTAENNCGLMAMLLLHDVQPWVSWCHTPTFNDAFDALDAFGYTDAEFIPYFDPIPPATTPMKDVYVSAYKRTNGGVLLVVGNLSHEDKKGSVRINAQRLGVSPKKVYSWPDRRVMAINEGNLPIEIPPQGYRLLFMEGANASPSKATKTTQTSPSSPRFTVGTGTSSNCVTDNLTRLTWLKNPDAIKRDWTAAMAFCEGLDGSDGRGNYTDWRLPSEDELRGLMDSKYDSPALSNTAGTGKWTAGDPFADVQTDYYWTSISSKLFTATMASRMLLYYGLSSEGDKTRAYYVWPVRGGK